MLEKKLLNDEELSQAAGGAGEPEGSETRTEEGTCPYCKRLPRYHVVRTFYTENGRNVLDFYECDMCGRID